MELNDFLEKFVDQFDEIETDKIKANTVFKVLDEWDSFISLSVIAMVDAEYNVKLKGIDIKAASTVEDLFNLIRSKMV